MTASSRSNACNQAVVCSLDYGTPLGKTCSPPVNQAFALMAVAYDRIQWLPIANGNSDGTPHFLTAAYRVSVLCNPTSDLGTQLDDKSIRGILMSEELLQDQAEIKRLVSCMYDPLKCSSKLKRHQNCGFASCHLTQRSTGTSLAVQPSSCSFVG